MEQDATCYDIESTEAINWIIESLESGRVAALLGAGASYDVSLEGPFLWPNLLQLAKDTFPGKAQTIKGMSRADRILSKLIETKEERSTFVSQLKDRMANFTSSVYHECLCSLEIKNIWTTNYDTSIEEYYKKHNSNSDVITLVSPNQYQPYNGSNSQIFIHKVNGCIAQYRKISDEQGEPENLVLTEGDFNAQRRYFGQSNPLGRKFLYTLENGSLLIIGLSFDEPFFKHQLIKLKKLFTLQTSQMQHFWFCIKKEYDRYFDQISELKNYGVRFLVAKNSWEEVEVFFRQLNESWKRHKYPVCNETQIRFFNRCKEVTKGAFFNVKLEWSKWLDSSTISHLSSQSATTRLKQIEAIYLNNGSRQQYLGTPFKRIFFLSGKDVEDGGLNYDEVRVLKEYHLSMACPIAFVSAKVLWRLLLVCRECEDVSNELFRSNNYLGSSSVLVWCSLGFSERMYKLIREERKKNIDLRILEFNQGLAIASFSQFRQLFDKSLRELRGDYNDTLTKERVTKTFDCAVLIDKTQPDDQFEIWGAYYKDHKLNYYKYSEVIGDDDFAHNETDEVGIHHCAINWLYRLIEKGIFYSVGKENVPDDQLINPAIAFLKDYRFHSRLKQLNFVQATHEHALKLDELL